MTRIISRLNDYTMQKLEVTLGEAILGVASMIIGIIFLYFTAKLGI